MLNANAAYRYTRDMLGYGAGELVLNFTESLDVDGTPCIAVDVNDLSGKHYAVTVWIEDGKLYGEY